MRKRQAAARAAGLPSFVALAGLLATQAAQAVPHGRGLPAPPIVDPFEPPGMPGNQPKLGRPEPPQHASVAIVDPFGPVYRPAPGLTNPFGDEQRLLSRRLGTACLDISAQARKLEMRRALGVAAEARRLRRLPPTACPAGTRADGQPPPAGDHMACRDTKTSTLHGWALTWWAHGAVASIVYHRSGEKDGPEVLFHPNGRKSAEHWYCRGRENGPSLTYHPTGIVWSTSWKIDGNDDGPYTELDQHGWIVVEGRYRVGRPVGVWKTYGEDGSIKVSRFSHEDDEPQPAARIR